MEVAIARVYNWEVVQKRKDKVTEEEEKKPRDAVLNPDHLVVGRDNVLPPEGELVVIVPGIVMLRMVFGLRVGSEARGCVHKRI